MVEALYVAVRVGSDELVLAFLQQTLQRPILSLSLLQPQFLAPPFRSALPDPVIPQHLPASYDLLLPTAPLPGSGSGAAPAAQTAQAGAEAQPLAAALSAG
jgi:hypothetical protein